MFRLFHPTSPSMRLLDFDCEPLESREMLAGTVFVSVTGNVLNIVGDDFDNSIKVDLFQPTQETRFVGLNGTNVVFADDNLDFADNISVQSGDGSDHFEFENLNRPEGNLTVFNSDGSDQLVIHDSRFRSVDIQNGQGTQSSGTQTIDLEGVFVDGDTSIDNTAVGGSHVLSVRDGATRRLHYAASVGFDRITVSRTQIGSETQTNDGLISIDTGRGGALIEISSSGPGGGNSIHGNVAVDFGFVDSSDLISANLLFIRDVRVRQGIIDINADGGLTSVTIENVDRMKQIKMQTGSLGGLNSEFNAARLALVESEIEFGGIALTSQFSASSVSLTDATVEKKVLVKATGTHGRNGFIFTNATVNRGADYLVSNVQSPLQGLVDHEFQYQFFGNTFIDGNVRLKTDKFAVLSEVEMIGSVIDGLLSHSGSDHNNFFFLQNGSQVTKNVKTTHFSGDGTIEINNNSRIGGSFTLVKNRGDMASDTFRLHNQSQIGKNVVLANRDGDSETEVFDSIIGGQLKLTNGDGVDQLAVDNSEFRNNVTVKNTIGESFSVIGNSSFLKKLVLDNGGKLKRQSEMSFDQLLMADNDVRGTFTISHGAGGSSTDIVGLEQSAAFKLSATHGDDLVKINDVQMRSSTTISVGSQSSREADEVGGTDHDDVFLDRNGSPESSVYSGSVKISTTSGNDRIRLAGNLSFVNTASFESLVSVDGGEGTDEFVEGLFSLFDTRPKLTNIESVS